MNDVAEKLIAEVTARSAEQERIESKSPDALRDQLATCCTVAVDGSALEYMQSKDPELARLVEEA